MTALDTDASLSGWLRRLANYRYVSELVAGKRVLELSCGTGLAARFLAESGAREVVGVDPAPAAIAEARKQHSLTNLDFRVEDPSSLELDDDSFGAVFVPDGVQPLRRRSVLEELRRVLEPGGLLVLSVGNADRAGAVGGASFFDLKERLEKLFPPVRMIAVAPFIGVSLVEYAAEASTATEVELDTALLELADDNDDDVSDYVALCGEAGAAFAGQFTVVQVPAAAGVEAARNALGGEQAQARRDEATARRLDKTLERVRELEAELVDRDSGGGEVNELRDRLTKVLDERDDLKHQIDALKRQINDAQQETGRVAADAGLELAKARGEAKTARQRVHELESRLSAEESAAPTNGVSVTEQIAEAMEAHAAKVKELEAIIDERSAYADEQSEERAAAVAAADDARAALADAQRRLAAREAELADYRTRIAVAEGELLKAKS